MRPKFLLALLFAYLRPAVDGDPEPDPQPDPEPDPDQQPDLDLDPADPESEPRLAPAEELETARREARENKERAERFEREAADLRTRHAVPQHNDEFAREEAKLKDPATPDLEKWQIAANRELRSNRSAAQAALAQAHDVSDRTAFTAISMADPVAKKYEARVEQELAKLRQNGQNAPRESIFTFLLGKDMREGKFKKKAQAAGADPKTVNRGKLPGARSDVSGRPGAMTNRERLAKKLENVSI